MVKYQTCLIRRVSRLYGESADDYEESADSYIPTCVSVLESADSKLELADSTADSTANPLRIGLWVRALSTSIYLGPIKHV